MIKLNVEITELGESEICWRSLEEFHDYLNVWGVYRIRVSV